MKHTSQTEFGRGVSVCSKERDPLPDGLVDKWAVLSALTEAPEHYELSHRTLGVLRALLTFLPTRVIDPRHGAAIVFPSNKTLSTRLNGMPESTLRRHLSALVKSGVVSRRDSANRKRFARRTSLSNPLAFGFDLSPLARLNGEIEGQASAAKQHAETLQMLRCEVAALRQEMIVKNGPCLLSDQAFTLLRRKPNQADLNAMKTLLSDALVTAKPSATDDQNERHIHIESKNISVAKAPLEPTDGQHEDTVLLHLVDHCKEYKSYFPEPIQNWRDVILVANRLVPMIGIDSAVFHEAGTIMGLKRASTVVLCLLETLSDITNPGGYLRRLTQRSREGCFSLDRLAKSLGLPQNCQLTI